VRPYWDPLCVFGKARVRRISWSPSALRSVRTRGSSWMTAGADIRNRHGNYCVGPNPRAGRIKMIQLTMKNELPSAFSSPSPRCFCDWAMGPRPRFVNMPLPKTGSGMFTKRGVDLFCDGRGRIPEDGLDLIQRRTHQSQMVPIRCSSRPVRGWVRKKPVWMNVTRARSGFRSEKGSRYPHPFDAELGINKEYPLGHWFAQSCDWER
jgi:hypothetical protein